MVKHPVVLRGAYAAGGDPDRLAPTILQLAEQDFVGRLLEDLATAEGRGRLRGAVAGERTEAGGLRLYQPVHRVFHAVLLDASCARPGTPRLDPGRIVGSGLVVRRLGPGGAQEAWMRREGRVVGWRPAAALGGEIRGAQTDPAYDPDPELRRARRLGCNAAALRHLEAGAGGEEARLREDTSSLFAAPAALCREAGRTFLYGLLPLASAERVEEEGPGAPPPFDRRTLRERMPPLLRAGGAERPGLPPTGRVLTPASRDDPSAKAFFDVLHYLARETGLFTDAPGTGPLRRVLGRIPLQEEAIVAAAAEKSGRTAKEKPRAPALREALRPEETLGGFLRLAHDVLLGQPEGAATEGLPASVTLPKAWPPIGAASGKGRGLRARRGRVAEEEILEAIHAAVAARWEAARPAEGRFDASGARYVAAAFLRVQDAPGCPPRTVWTRPTEPFEIVPWYESGRAAPVEVRLPEVGRDALAKLRPNVTFRVPPSLQKVLDKLSLGKLLEGETEEGSARFGMLCGFNIPIITLCAFIVLQIFLQLLNLVFWWLPFVRICIPFPKGSGE
ncbi:MAG: hypothetical protein Kow0092_31350 [Deferrisomatales bacterium]